MRNYYCYTLIFSDRFDMIFRRAVFDRPYGFFGDRKAVQSFHSDTALSFVLYLVLVIYSVWLCHSSVLTPHSSIN